MAGYFRAPRHALVPVPAGLSLDDASISEPGAVAWHACRKAGVSEQTRVLVVGAGAIGILAVLAAREMGAPEVGLEEAPRAFAVAAARPPGTFKVVVHP
jgi:threonine dehydrogenase-like Zn-dependent dehydrogenase